MFSEKILKIFSVITITIIAYIILLALLVKTPEMTNLPSFVILPAVIISAFLLLFCFFMINGLIPNKRVFISIALIFMAITRLIWIFFIRTEPISDFLLYQNYATNASNGIFNIFDPSYNLFPFKFGYPLVIAFVYKIFGALLLNALVFNVLLSCVLGICVYWLCGLMFNFDVARFAILLFAFWPAQILYNSVLASEHVFMVFFVLNVGFIIKITKTKTPKLVYLNCVLAGVFLALANFIRPMALMLLPIYIVLLLINANQSNISFPSILYSIKSSLVLFASFLLTFIILTYPLSQVIGVPIWKSSAGYNLYVGTNYSASGKYNVADERSLDPYKNDYNLFHKVALDRAIQRVVEHPLLFINLIERKTLVLWTSEDYGVYWSTLQLQSENQFSKMVIKYQKILTIISQMFYLAMLAFALFGCYRIFKKNNLFSLCALFVFAGLFFAFSLLEVQSRYHLPAMPIIICFGAYGMDYLIKESKIESIIKRIISNNKEIFRFAVVGCVNTLVDFSVFSVAHSVFGLDKLICQTLGYGLGIVNSFALNKIWTFQGIPAKSSIGNQFGRFVLVNSVSLLVTLFGLKTLSETFGVNIYVSKVIITGIAQVINFFGYKIIVFARYNEAILSQNDLRKRNLTSRCSGVAHNFKETSKEPVKRKIL